MGHYEIKDRLKRSAIKRGAWRLPGEDAEDDMAPIYNSLNH
jgi:hypothetical protein